MLGDSLGTVAGKPCATAGEWAMAGFQDTMRAVSIASLAYAGLLEEEGTAFFRCFPAGTKVLMADGSTKSIEDVKEGDEVLAADPSDGQPAGPHKVQELHENWTRRLIHILVRKDGDVGSGGEIQATGEHPFWTVNRGWVNAKDLVAGDRLLSPYGDEPVVVSITSAPTVTATYNLSIEGTHAFFVMAGDTPVLVHNQSLGGVGTMGTMPSSPIFQRHEVLPAQWLFENGYGPYRAGPFWNDNPAIYVPNDVHYQINGLQTDLNIGSGGDFSVSAEEILAKNAAILEHVAQDAGLTDAQIQQVMSDAYDYAKSLPTPCP